MYIAIKEVDVESLRLYLLSLPAFKHGCTEPKLLSAVGDKIRRAGSVYEICDVLTSEYASFLNYDIFKVMLERFGGCQEEQYTTHLKNYIDSHNISNFMGINPALKAFMVPEGSKKIKLKFDIEETCRVTKVFDLKKAVANILDLNRSTLQLFDKIEKGCVVVTFLIPVKVADVIFRSGMDFTAKVVEKFQAIAVIRLECGDLTFDVSKGVLRDAEVKNWTRDALVKISGNFC